MAYNVVVNQLNKFNMKKENEMLNHAIWMLASAIQNITCAQRSHDEKHAIEWLTGAVDCIANAEKALEETKILPF